MVPSKDTFRVVHICVLFLFQVCSSQRFDFPRPLIVSETCGRGSPLEDITVDGTLTLTKQDLSLFQPRVIIQATYEFCDIDLTSCDASNQSTTPTKEGCSCTKGADDVFQLHIRAAAMMKLPKELAEFKIQASVPSKDIYNTTVAGIGAIGSIFSESGAKVNATYQLDGQPAQVLHDHQTVHLCSNKYEGINICARNAHFGASLRVAVKGQQQVTSAPCVKMVTDYDFSEVTSYQLTFVVEESTDCAHVFYIDIREKLYGC